MSLSKNEFLKRYDTDGLFWFHYQNGKINTHETALDLDLEMRKNLAPHARFIEDMGQLSLDDFQDIVSRMSRDAIVYYLYNKFVLDPAKNLRHSIFDFVDNGLAYGTSHRDGHITNAEIGQRGRDFQYFVDLLDMRCSDPRDRWLLSSGVISLFENNDCNTSLKNQLKKPAPMGFSLRP